MVSAKESTLIGVEMDRATSIPILNFDYEMWISETVTYSFEESNKTTINSPLIQDPYEKTFIDIHESRIQGAGLGAFIRQSAKNGTAVSFYNGIRYLNSEVRSSQYRIDNDWAVRRQVIDIPKYYK